MIFFLVLALCCAAVSATQIPPAHSPIIPGGRIVGGVNASIESYPYQVSVAYDGSHSCGGSIISPRLILTAGHCVTAKPYILSVRTGSDCRDTGKVFRVQKIIQHEQYGVTTYGIPINDVALLLLEKPIVFNKTSQPIGLFNEGEEAAPGAQAVITGWGRLSSGGIRPSQLQVVSVPIVDKDLCDSAYVSWGGLPENQICAAYYGQGGKDSCQGDSGGPLVVNGRQAGIVSWGNGCALPYYPGVYTEVASFRSWIDEKIKQYENIDELRHL